MSKNSKLCNKIIIFRQDHHRQVLVYLSKSTLGEWNLLIFYKLLALARVLIMSFINNKANDYILLLKNYTG